MSKHERLHMINIKNKNEHQQQQQFLLKQPRQKAAKDVSDARDTDTTSHGFMFYSKERKQSLTSNDSSYSCASSHSSPNTPPWTSSSVSNSSQSPPPAEQASSSIVKPAYLATSNLNTSTPTTTNTTKTFHNILNLINCNSASNDSGKDREELHDSAESNIKLACEHEKTNTDVLQTHLLNSSSFEEYFRLL